MPRREDELPTIDLTTLSRVTGGANTDLSSMMMPLMMMMKNRQPQASAAPAPAAAAAPTAPQIMVNGVAQNPTSTTSAGTNYAIPSDLFSDSDY